MTFQPISRKELYDGDKLQQIRVTSGPVCFMRDCGTEQSESSLTSKDKGKATDKTGIVSISSSEPKHDGEYRVSLDYLGREFPDPSGANRWYEYPSITEGRMLVTRQVDRVIEAFRDLYSPIFKPIPIVFIPSTGQPECGKEAPMAKASESDVMIRILLKNVHYTALVHFRTIRSIVAFDSFGSPDMDEMIESQLKIVPPSADDMETDTESYWGDKVRLMPRYQKDGWSCGLWCLAFVEVCLKSILEQISINETTPDYTAAINSIRQRVADGKLRRLEVEEANQFLFARMVVS